MRTKKSKKPTKKNPSKSILEMEHLATVEELFNAHPTLRTLRFFANHPHEEQNQYLIITFGGVGELHASEFESIWRKMTAAGAMLCAIDSKARAILVYGEQHKMTMLTPIDCVHRGADSVILLGSHPHLATLVEAMRVRKAWWRENQRICREFVGAMGEQMLTTGNLIDELVSQELIRLSSVDDEEEGADDRGRNT